MIPIGGTREARALDARAIDAGIPLIILMENAAFSLWQAVQKETEVFKPERIVIFTGRGGNGGDGLALARLINDRGPKLPVGIVPFFNHTEITGDTLTNWKILPRDIGVFQDYQREITGRVLFVDALIGTGLDRPLSEELLAAVRFINRYPCKRVIAVDMPTGLSGDTGKALPEAVKADTTVAMGLLKIGLFLGTGITHAGKVMLGAISAAKSVSPHTANLLEETDIKVPPVPLDAYKNKFGHLLIAGGSCEKLGASVIAAQAFLASGGGLVTIAVPQEVLASLAGRFPGIMLTSTEQALHKHNHYSLLLLGPGLAPETFDKAAEGLLSVFKGSVILDAGMIDVLAARPDLEAALAEKEVIFTPHPGELKRFSEARGIGDSWLAQVQNFPLGKQHTLLAKNAASFIRSADNLAVVPHGAKALAFGGSGDALAGIAAAFLAYKTPFEAACSAAMIHRRAGLQLEKIYGETAHCIETLISCIPAAFQYMREP